MRKLRNIFILTICVFLCVGCNTDKKTYNWSEAMNYRESSEAGIDLSVITLSDDGEKFFEQLSEELMPSAEDAEMLEIAVQETQVFSVEGGYFVEQGYRINGAADTQWYEISFLSDGISKTLHTGQKTGTMLFAAEGDTLYLLWQNGLLSALDSSGNMTELCDIRSEFGSGDFMGIDSSLTGSDNIINASIVIYSDNLDQTEKQTVALTYDINTGKFETNR